MKNLLILVFVLISNNVLAQETYYTCVMHPEIRSASPGKCPKCGMALTKKTVKKPPVKNIPKPAPRPVTKPNPKTVIKQAERQAKDSVPLNNEGHDDHGGHVRTDVDQIEDSMQQEPVLVNMAPGKTVTYHLYVADTMVNFTGKNKRGIAINGSIPAPTLEFTEGDTAEIYLHNNLKKEETSLHWHGVILPNRFDGVPYLTTKRIGPGETHLYKFKVVQNGTYWYHSHTALQEQSGMYGALIFKKRVPEKKGINNHVNVVLSEWTDEDPNQVQRRLRTGTDWYAIKKQSTQSYSEAIRAGHFKTKVVNEWKRMEAMDVSDVYYNRFLINGKPESVRSSYKHGDTINLHIVNAGASSYFWLNYGGGKITVTANDGNDIVPVEVDRLIIAPSETYDLTVTIPDTGSYEFRATPEDRSGAASLWLGNGKKNHAPIFPRLKYFEGMKMMNDMMKMNGTMNDMGMNMSLQKMDMNSVMYPEIMDAPAQSAHSGEDHSMHTSELVTLNYDMMRSPSITALPDGSLRTLHFNLTGNMNRYVWTLDNKTVVESDRIMIRKGENLRLILTNNSMMRHPMHLHGHDFRVVNSHGDYAPFKNVLDIMPMETDTIEFAGSQDGHWFFHCHILYHMMAGMGRVFTYENSQPNPELPDKKEAGKLFRKDNTMHHFMIRGSIESNGSDGEAMWSSERFSLNGLWHMGTKPHHGYEVELAFGRYLAVNQWLFPYIGFDYHYKKTDDLHMAEEEKNMFGQQSNKNNRKTVTAGIMYTLPWLMMADARVDGNGKFRFQLGREDIPLTPRLRMAFMGNTDKEYMAGFRYILTKWLSLSTHYDSDMGVGAGITLTY